MRQGIRAFLIEVGAVYILGSIIFLGLVFFRIIDISPFLATKSLVVDPLSQKTYKPPVEAPNASNSAQSATIISDLVQRYKRILSDSAVTLVTEHTIYEGKISEIDTKGGLEKRLNLQYVLMLKIKGKGSIINQVYFSQPDMAQIKIVQETAGQETPLNISSFKVGDSVILNLTIDQLKSTYDNILSGKLTKL